MKTITKEARESRNEHFWWRTKRDCPSNQNSSLPWGGEWYYTTFPRTCNKVHGKWLTRQLTILVSTIASAQLLGCCPKTGAHSNNREFPRITCTELNINNFGEMKHQNYCDKNVELMNAASWAVHKKTNTKGAVVALLWMTAFGISCETRHCTGEPRAWQASRGVVCRYVDQSHKNNRSGRESPVPI